ncbi:MAG TPA: SDR family NAD(P)-dependent oxidoreductase [Candidatus Binatia bacterium]|jgi:3-oxoacyl-[acyl-carrier protein] reductase
MPGEFRGDSAFITGAASGIGLALARRLAGEGIKIALADRESTLLEAALSQMRDGHHTAIAITMDVSRSDEVVRGIARARSAFGPIDYLINLAGISQNAPVQDISDQDWERMLAIHLNGTFYCCRAVIAQMISRGFGVIVNTSSLHALRGQKLAAHYSAAKAGIMGFTKSLAREVAECGVRVNAIAPGPIDTPLWRGGVTGSDLESRKAQRSLEVPMGRLGEASEVADLILFLLSQRSTYVTGQVISVNGGELMI